MLLVNFLYELNITENIKFPIMMNINTWVFSHLPSFFFTNCYEECTAVIIKGGRLSKNSDFRNSLIREQAGIFT
jgi:hypothetical protein